MRKQDNQGFALLEVLTAVCIMAIIMIPLLHSFLTAYRVNAKSKEILRATTLAQNEMEIFEKETIEDLSSSGKFQYELVNINQGSGILEFVKKGITNADGDKAKFDVSIILDPLRSSPSESYYLENKEKILDISTVSGLDSGTYIQPIQTMSSAASLDESVYSIFHKYKDMSGMGASYTKSDFEKKIERTIRITVSQTREINPSTIVKVKYIYSCKEPGVMLPSHETYEKESVIFDNSQVLDETGKKMELQNIYLFFAPRYETSKIDHIEIVNMEDVTANFYIIRQEVQKRDGSGNKEMPATYQAAITIYDDLTKEGVTNGKYFTNLNLSESPTVGTGQQMQVRLTLNSAPFVFYDRQESIAKTGLKPIGASEAKDRIYAMKVNVYRHGADRSAEEPLVSLVGTKLD